MKTTIILLAIMATMTSSALTLTYDAVVVQTGTVAQADAANFPKGTLLVDGDNILRWYDGSTVGGYKVTDNPLAGYLPLSNPSSVEVSTDSGSLTLNAKDTLDLQVNGVTRMSMSGTSFQIYDPLILTDSPTEFYHVGNRFYNDSRYVRFDNLTNDVDISSGTITLSPSDSGGDAVTVDGNTTINGALTVTAQSTITGALLTTTKTTAVNYTVGTTSAREAYNGIICVTGASTIGLPSVADGMHVTITTIGNVSVDVTPDGTDIIILDGVNIGNNTASNNGNAGETIELWYYGSGTWVAISHAGFNGP